MSAAKPIKTQDPGPRAPVITGLGVVSPFGVGREVFFDGLRRGACAIRPIASFDASRFPVNHAGEVPIPAVEAGWLGSLLAWDASTWKSRGWLRDRKVPWALLAAREALRQARISSAADLRVSLALGLEQALLQDFLPIFRGGEFHWEDEPGADLPPTRFRTPADLASRALREYLGLAVPPVLHVSACAAGTLALAHGAALVRRGEADAVLCGAADAMINPLGLGGMIRLGAASPRNVPEACRPFDQRRDGLVLGEGAALFVVESEARARARGAEILGRVLGWGSSQDAYRATMPRPDGAAAARAMSAALRSAGLAPEEVDYVNAHGTGTPLNDPAEAKALHSSLGAWAAKVPVSSIKGAVGHLMAAAGALEAAACLLPLQEGILPGTVNLQEPDPECALNLLREPARGRVRHVLSNSFGFGGQNACVVLGAP